MGRTCCGIAEYVTVSRRFLPLWQQGKPDRAYRPVRFLSKSFNKPVCANFHREAIKNPLSTGHAGCTIRTRPPARRPAQE